ncbi:MAG: tetratricopeptide repeat protein [Gammaproteobacteria bacterium]|nr:tetratricopeptide repeat protein [Gammaproteobacteria bacterium]
MRERITGPLLAGLLLFAGAAGASPLEEAIAAYELGEFDRAIPALTAAAEGGDPLAQVYLGLAYYNGYGVPEDDRIAFTWFWRAAEQGFAEGQFQLGFMYTYGFGIPEGEPDPEGKAVEWFARAADQGHAEAQFNLGLMLLAGSGTPRDEEAGMHWIETAARNGSPGARRFTGDLD